MGLLALAAPTPPRLLRPECGSSSSGDVRKRVACVAVLDASAVASSPSPSFKMPRHLPNTAASGTQGQDASSPGATLGDTSSSSLGDAAGRCRAVTTQGTPLSDESSSPDEDGPASQGATGAPYCGESSSLDEDASGGDESQGTSRGEALSQASSLADATGREPVAVYGAAATIGKRPHMEDRHVIERRLGACAHVADDARSRLAGVQFCSILDGHGGSRSVDFIAAQLPRHLASDEALSAGASPAALRSVFRRAFLACDAAFLDSIRAERRSDGATALCALLCGTTLALANVGDTRGVLGRRPAASQPRARGASMRARELEAVRISVDHKPNLPKESARVRASGGTVRNLRGVWRVCSAGAYSRTCKTTLAISRAFGNLELKELAGAQPLVTAEPYVALLELSRRDRFVILASDGLWDVVEDAEAVRMVSALVAEELKKGAAAAGGGAARAGAVEAVVDRGTAPAGAAVACAEAAPAVRPTSLSEAVSVSASPATPAACGDTAAAPGCGALAGGGSGSVAADALLEEGGHGVAPIADDAVDEGVRAGGDGGGEGGGGHTAREGLDGVQHEAPECARAVQAAAEALVAKATERGSLDNITVVVLWLDWD